jgi:hypothetical protein
MEFVALRRIVPGSPTARALCACCRAAKEFPLLPGGLVFPQLVIASCQAQSIEEKA